jgi:hypothetical protein
LFATAKDLGPKAIIASMKEAVELGTVKTERRRMRILTTRLAAEREKTLRRSEKERERAARRKYGEFPTLIISKRRRQRYRRPSDLYL